ncbi:hypothetical protein L4D04_21515 [Photobacterium angustum]|uniref:Uncharacterized protein n=1 Tax=Photobacterium angustum (strain S14 / CCUG 15956) TaxID=314292 RepID=Q1ZSX0_PHOAS|nr:hypothetical protein [Photobacterium angustum]EAS64857.1 hypothetical protein VAS14_04038 [Photobacterium angustum S14]
MTLTIEMIASYLGKNSSAILSEHPFKNWKYEKSTENDLENTQFDYVFPDDGMDFVTDEQDKVSSIYLYFDGYRNFGEDLKDLELNSRRNEVIVLFGSPSKSGDAISDSVLGEYGAWDRFSRAGFAIHIEYRVGSETINKVTLMRADVVP